MTERLQKSVAHQELQTGLDLVEGKLPDFQTKPQDKKQFLERTLKMYTQVTREAICEKVKEHLGKQLRNKNVGEHTCTHCKKPARNCIDYLNHVQWV